MKTDVQIAQESKMVPINDIASKLGIKEDDVINYGKYKAKISSRAIEDLKNKPDGKLI